MNLALLKDIATIAGVCIAVLSLAFTAFNTRLTSRSNRARFWLELRDRFARHEEVHNKLRGGAWTHGGAPVTGEEWASLEAYMGLFEHCEAMLEQSLIDGKTFKEIYGYRLYNIVANDVIVEKKLVDHASDWKRFLALLHRAGILERKLHLKAQDPDLPRDVFKKELKAELDKAWKRKEHAAQHRQEKKPAGASMNSN
jgi:hypothetical protein